MREIALEILGTGEYVPSHHIDSESLDRAFNKASGWTFDQTGVRERAHARSEENVVSMGAAAARQALENAGMPGEALDLIISVGSVPAQAIPCTAALLQRELGLAESGTAAFDLNATCLGFLAALDLVAQGIAMQRYKAVLIVAAERVSIGLKQSDPLTAGLFGDGAGAVVIGPSRAGKSAMLSSLFQTYSVGAEYCRVRAGGSLINPHTQPEAYLEGSFFEMRGRRLYKLVADKMPGFLRELLRRADLSMQDINVWVPHQASGHALKHIRAALDLPAERFVSTLETHGNQVSASLPVALHRGIKAGQIVAGHRVALVGTGAGLSFGGAVLRF
jgi:3-oxoacyl-[acyl-carrier-protein] synthase-3